MTPPAAESTHRVCGECSLCCTVLRVDELEKLGGMTCREQRSAEGARALGGGCGIHATRPAICRGYRCAWLQGKLEASDRPDRIGAVLDLVTSGVETRLDIHLAAPDGYERSARLGEIAEQHRRAMPVRILDVGDVLDPDRPYRILLPGGEEQHVRGEHWVHRRADGTLEERRLPWLERTVRRLAIAWRRRRFRRFASGAHGGNRR